MNTFQNPTNLLQSDDEERSDGQYASGKAKITTDVRSQEK